MQICSDVKSNMKRLCLRLQAVAGSRRRKPTKRVLQISAPFDFRKEETMLPGLSEDEISVLREKAAASRLGVADHDRDYTSPFGSPMIPTRTSSKSATSLGFPPSPLAASPVSVRSRMR